MIFRPCDSCIGSIIGNVFIPLSLLPRILSVHYVRCLLLRGKWRLFLHPVHLLVYHCRSMNKSACLADIIDSVRNLEEAVEKDIGVARTCVMCVTVNMCDIQRLLHVLLVIVMNAVLHQV